MKKRILYILGTGLIVLSFAYALPVSAVEDEPSAASEATRSAARQERIEKHKAALATKLTADQQAHYKARCKAAQSVVGTIHDRLGNSLSAKTQAFERLPEHVSNILTKLEDKDLDLEELKSNQAQLMVKINTFKTDLADYRQTLSDMKEMACETDPDGFKAALEAARTTRAKLAASVADIKSYVNDTIKVTLKSLRTQLAEEEE